LEINLHIGAHRNASTTMQQFLDRNQTGLRQTGVEVWTPSRTRKGLFAGLIERPEDVTEQLERRGSRSCGLIAIEMERLVRAGRRQLLISDENMIGTTRNNLRHVRLYPRVDERLRRFRPGLAPGLRRIGLSIRSYDTFWASCLAFGLTQGFRMPLTADLDHYITQPRRWRDLVRDVASAFPGVEILVWPYERFAGQPDVQLAILTGGIASDLPFTGARDWTNASPRCDKLRRILIQRGETALGRSFSDQDGRWMPFDEAQRLALRAQYAVDLDWLRRGADGLARLVEQAPDHNPTITITKTHDMDENQGMPRAHAPPHVLTAGGQQFGTQDFMV
jgi:hypothetical protein